MNVFLSYRRHDADHASGRIADRLRTQFGKDSIFKDIDSIPIGADFVGVVQEKLSQADVMVLLIGDRWINGKGEPSENSLYDPHDMVRVELEAAFQQGLPVIPVLVGQAKMPDPSDLPPSVERLWRLNAAPLRDTDFDSDLERLVRILQSYSGNEQTPKANKDSLEMSYLSSPHLPLWERFSKFPKRIITGFTLGAMVLIGSQTLYWVWFPIEDSSRSQKQTNLTSNGVTEEKVKKLIDRKFEEFLKKRGNPLPPDQSIPAEDRSRIIIEKHKDAYVAALIVGLRNLIEKIEELKVYPTSIKITKKIIDQDLASFLSSSNAQLENRLILDSNTVIENFMATKDSISLGITNGPEGETIRVSVDNYKPTQEAWSFPHLLLLEILEEINILVKEPELFADDSIGVKMSYTWREEFFTNVTTVKGIGFPQHPGIIINAKDFSLEKPNSVQLILDDGRIIFKKNHMREQNTTPVIYEHSLEAARKVVGGSLPPLIIPAIRVEEEVSSNIVIADVDAQLIQLDPENLDILRKGHLIIVVNPFEQ